MRCPASGACAAAMILALVGCGDSRSPSEASPVRTPAVVAGQWSGTFSIDDHDTCKVSNVPATATLQQQGASVTGTFVIAPVTCGVGTLDFEGTMSGSVMSGRVFAAGQLVSEKVKGFASEADLRVDLGVDPSGFPRGALSLHR